MSNGNQVSYRIRQYDDVDIADLQGIKGIEIYIGSEPDKMLPAEEYPLISSPVMPGMDYEKVISILQIEKIVEQTKPEAPDDNIYAYYTFDFESQYGKTLCSYAPHWAGGDYMKLQIQTEVHKINPGETGLVLSLSFKDDILVDVSCAHYYKTE